jgi:hypothetical protein
VLFRGERLWVLPDPKRGFKAEGRALLRLPVGGEGARGASKADPGGSSSGGSGGAVRTFADRPSAAPVGRVIEHPTDLLVDGFGGGHRQSAGRSARPHLPAVLADGPT